MVLSHLVVMVIMACSSSFWLTISVCPAYALLRVILEKYMDHMEKLLDERFFLRQQCFLSHVAIISDKLDAVVAAMSHYVISNRPTPSHLLTTVKDIQGNPTRGVTPATLRQKAVTSNM